MHAHRPLPITRDLVLLGGGHAHALVLKKWAMAPLPGAQVTIVNPQAKAPYTGMLPGFVAGHYQRDELDIDLVQLARQANARLVIDHAIGIDLEQKTIKLSAAPDLAYDTLSIDIGITSKLVDLPGAGEHLIPAKPLGAFSKAWSALMQRTKTEDFTPEIAILGGGVAGAELALAMAFHLNRDLRGRGRVRLVEASSDILAELRPPARKTLIRELDAANVEIVLNTRATKVSERGVHTASDGALIEANFIVSAAGAQPHAWLENTGLQLSDGYIAVDETLRATGSPGIFAAGDCAHLTHAPRPKAGVFAVRQAPILYTNLRANLSGGTLRPYKPQKDYLKLISTGRKSAVTDKWGIGLSGEWVWRLKDRIDQKFMDQFRTPTAMSHPTLPPTIADGVSEYMQQNENPCGGCGAKLGQASLTKGLGSESDSMEDAAIIGAGAQARILSTDHLRAFNADPYVLAKIAAIHALGDVWAMGATPDAVLSQIILPPLSNAKQANMLREITAGAREVVDASGAQIVGGHTSSGAELTIGFTVSAPSGAKVIRQSGAQDGDIIVLTKPIGTGVLLAAEMRQLADGDDYLETLETMLRPQARASSLLASAATAMTDVTGFGLAGHLLNILDASNVSAVLEGRNIPVLSSALHHAANGIRSTLWSANRTQASRVSMTDGPLKDLLFDPQTCGGLLATIPVAQSDSILAKFEEFGEPIWQIGKIASGAPTIKTV
ncbi:MAG: selenide, water dikinase SelD [Henriciella sp.]